MRSSKKPAYDQDEVAARLAIEIKKHDFGGKNPAAVLLGHLGGLKGGPARAASLSPRQRKEIAQKAATTRWTREKGTYERN